MKGNDHTKIWVERDGTRTPIPHMGDRQVYASIIMVKHTPRRMKDGRRWREEYLPRLEAELQFREARYVAQGKPNVFEEFRRKAKERRPDLRHAD